MVSKAFVGTVAATVAAIGASGALAAGSQGGYIRFIGAVYAPGYSMGAAPRVGATGTTGALQTQTVGSGNQVVVDFSASSAQPVPAEVTVMARSQSSATWQSVGGARNPAGLRVRYDGFTANVLAGKSGTLTVSRSQGAEPVLAVVTAAYR